MKESIKITGEKFRAAVMEVSQIGKALAKSGMSDRMVELLIADLTKLPRRDIREVLNALPKLERYYLRKSK